MKDFDESPLDLDGDGDDAVEMSLFFNNDEKNKKSGDNPPDNSGCCLVLLGLGSSLLLMGPGVAKLIA